MLGPAASSCQPGRMRRVLVFTVVYTVALFAFGRGIESPLTGLYTGINVGLVILFGMLHRWARWPLHALWAVSFVGLGNMLGGVVLVGGVPLYTVEFLGPIRYDKVFHAVASAAMAIIAWEAIKTWAGEGFHRTEMLLVIAFLVVMGGGAVVEIAELIGSAMSDVSVGDYANNALDLVANAVGAGAAVTAIWRWEQALSMARDGRVGGSVRG